jgi:hypothetical protein
MGISRSATVVAAYLTFRHGLTPAEALAWIGLRRPIINPNSGFREQLQDYYSVLQMDHGDDFGWKGISMNGGFVVDQERERVKRERRRLREKVMEQWEAAKVEWCDCFVRGWGKDIENIVQRQISSFGVA